MIEKAINENTAALLELAASNRELAEAIKQGPSVSTLEATTSDEPKKEAPAKKPEGKTKKDKAPAKTEKPEEKEATTSDEGEVMADDLRKVAGHLVENENKAGLQKVLKKFETKNITAFDKEGGDLAAMLAALEEEAGVKLGDIAD